MTDRMFYKQTILEVLTKKTFYDSPRIVLTDLEQSLLEKKSTSLVFTHRLHARWHGNKACYSTSVNLKVPALSSASFIVSIKETYSAGFPKPCQRVSKAHSKKLAKSSAEFLSRSFCLPDWPCRVKPIPTKDRDYYWYGTRLGDLKENWFLLFSN